MGKKETGKEILAWVKLYAEQHGFAPSVREICGALGLKSTATVYYHLRQLAQQGLISMEPGKKRAVRVLAAQPAGRNETTYSGQNRQKSQRRQEQDKNYVPLVGSVAAGQPIFAVENIDGYLPWKGGEGWFALRVQGMSMKDAGILPGDQLIVRPQPTAEQGEIVVALLGDEATVKRLSKQNGEIWLLPENENYAPIDGSEAVILGVVRGVVREYR